MSQRWDRDAQASGPVVSGFRGRGFVVDGGVYEGLLLTPQSAEQWDAPPPLDGLGLEHLAALLALQPKPEFILIGTGGTTRFAPRALVRALEQRGIGIEAMDSRAAARTWGLLRAEERWIAAALMAL